MQKRGVHPQESKFSKNSPSWEISLPDELYIHMKQHIGEPCVPLVKKGDKVSRFQKIGGCDKPISAPVHSPVSGEVIDVRNYPHPNGTDELAVVIRPGPEEDVPEVEMKEAHRLAKAEIISIVKEAGIVGLGGAMFPTHVKLTIPKGKSVETVIINGAECEPFLTADHRLMVERPEEIMKGVRLVMKAVDARHAVIAIESNKPDAVDTLRHAVRSDPRIEVLQIPSIYPQGAERVMVKTVTRKDVPLGGLPLDVGVVVLNVATVFAVYEAAYVKKPLVERIVTVTGEVRERANVISPFGTPYSHLINECGGYVRKPGRLVCGGPMMGLPQHTDAVSTIKGNNGIMVLKGPGGWDEEPCIRCGRCVDVCPAFLSPTTIMHYAKKGKMGFAKSFNVKSCFECGSCSFICPSKIDLVAWLRMAKK